MTTEELMEKVKMCWEVATTVQLGTVPDGMFERDFRGVVTINNVRFQTYVKLLDMVLR